MNKQFMRVICFGFVILIMFSYTFSNPQPPEKGLLQQLFEQERGETIRNTGPAPARPSVSIDNNILQDLKKSLQTRNRTDHPFSELNQLSYPELINLLVTIEWSDIPGLFNFSAGSNEFFGDSNRVNAIINAIEDRGNRFTSSDDMGIPTLIEVLRAGFFLGFYHDELNYLNNKEPFIMHILKPQQSIATNPNFGWGTETQVDILKAFGYLMGIGKTNKDIVLRLVPIFKTFNENFGEWVIDYDKSSALWGLGNGVDYALVAVDLYVNSHAEEHACYDNIDAYWDELAKAAQFGIINDDIVWLINNAVWWCGRIGRFVVKPKQIDVLLDIIDLYGKWEQPSLEAIKVLNAYYPDDHPFDIDKIKEEVHAQLLPNYYRFDNGKIIFNVGTGVTLKKVKTLYWAIKEVKAQFHRYVGTDEPVDQGHPDDSLIARVYSSPGDYNYNNFLYGLSTANGGMYIETWGTFFTYERTPDQSIYTLEDLFRHEYTHFLQSKYISPGYWGGALWSNDRLTWLEEGGAEYTAGSSRGQGIRYRKAMAKNIDNDPGSRMSLDEVLRATYSSGFTFYTYACVFFSYMYENRLDILTNLLGYVKEDDAQEYDNYINQLRGDAALSTAYNNYMQSLVDNANSYVDPTTSPDYLATITAGNLQDIQSTISTISGISDITSQVDSSDLYHTYLMSGTYTGNQQLGELEAWPVMDSVADSFIDKLDDLSWEGYKTVTCYFTNYRSSGNSYQYDVTFRGLLKLGDQNPIVHGASKGTTFPATLSFTNPYKPGSIIQLHLPETIKDKKHSFDVSIFNVNGKRVMHKTITKKSSFTWSGCSQTGTQASKGFYILTVSGERFVLNRKLVLAD